MLRRAEWKTAAYAAPGRMENCRTYRRPHRTGRKITAQEGSLPRILQAMLGRQEEDNIDAMPGRKEDDNDDAMPGMKKDNNRDAMLGMKEDEHDE